MISKKEALGKISFHFVILLTLLILAWVNHPISAISKEAGISARFTSTIQLRDERLEISYSSNTAELKLKLYQNDEKPEYEVTFSSKKSLGLLIIVEDGKVSYTATPLEPGEKWEPLEEKIDEARYKKVASLSQKPGWEILVMEKVKSLSA